METQKMITLSKQHLRLSTRKMLQEASQQFPFVEVYKKSGSGWFMYIDKDFLYDAVRYEKYPGDLVALLDFVLQCEGGVLCIDDVEPLLCLPQYDYRYHVPVTGGNPGETCTVEDIYYGGTRIGHNVFKKENNM